MKPSEVWLPKGRTHSSRDGVVECTQKPPWNWLADIVSIGVLILTAAGILAVSDALQKKGVAGKPDPTELNVLNVRQDTVEVDSRPTNPEPASRPISDDPSSPPIQSVVIRGLPGSSFESSATDKPAFTSSSPIQSAVIGGLPGSSFEPSATGKPASRRLGTESNVRGWHFHRQFSAVAQKPSHPKDNKGKWPKAFITYLEAHQSLMRKMLRHSETVSPNTRK